MEHLDRPEESDGPRGKALASDNDTGIPQSSARRRSGPSTVLSFASCPRCHGRLLPRSSAAARSAAGDVAATPHSARGARRRLVGGLPAPAPQVARTSMKIGPRRVAAIRAARDRLHRGVRMREAACHFVIGLTAREYRGSVRRAPRRSSAAPVNAMSGSRSRYAFSTPVRDSSRRVRASRGHSRRPRASPRFGQNAVASRSVKADSRPSGSLDEIDYLAAGLPVA